MSFYKNAGGMVCPATKEELIKEISIRLDKGQANMNDIDTSKITDMSLLFSEFSTRDIGYIDISLWDVSNVENMANMFTFCPDINCDLSKWNVSKVKDMTSMFYNCYKFNCDLSKWDVSNVEKMSFMFYKCSNFNSDLSNWNTHNVGIEVLTVIEHK